MTPEIKKIIEEIVQEAYNQREHIYLSPTSKDAVVYMDYFIKWLKETYNV